MVRVLLIGAAIVLAAATGEVGAQHLKPETANNAIVSEKIFDCENGYVSYLRTAKSYCRRAGYPNEVDLCQEWKTYGVYQGRGRSYPDPDTKEEHWVGAVGGMYWPTDAGTATFFIKPWSVATDGPHDTNSPCVDAVRLVSHPEQDIQGSIFSYFIFDLTKKIGCAVKKATLKFKVSPWYSGSAQEGTVRAKLGVFDMLHSGENLINDGKRTCFGDLVKDTKKNPIQFQFPLSKTEFNDYRHYDMDVTASVQADLNDPDATGYAGFLFASRGFGKENMDFAKGVRGLGFTEVILEVELGDCGPAPTLSPSSTMECAAFLFDRLILRVPCLELGGAYYWIDLLLSNTDPIEFTLAGIGPGPETEQCATFNSLNMILRIPCLMLGCVSYWVELQVVNLNPITLRVVNAGLN